MGGFQKAVNTQPAPAVAGDFASTNPRFTVDAGPGGLVAGALGVYVGRFAWWDAAAIDQDNAPQIVNNFGTGPVTGFVHREQQGLITDYLEEASMRVPQGFPITLFNGGDFWVVNDGASEAIIGMKAYANFGDGKVTFAATGDPATGGSGSASTIAAETAAITGSIEDDVLTVTAVGSGTVYPGSVLSGTDVASGTTILQQLTGDPGCIGTYAVSIPDQAVASTAITAAYGLLTVGGTVAGAFAVNDVLSGSGVTAGTTITAFGTGTGGAGTYVVTPSQTVGSPVAISVAEENVETKWIAMSAGAPGELIKISDHPLG